MPKLATASFVMLVLISSSAGAAPVAPLGEVPCAESCLSWSWRPPYCSPQASIDTSAFDASCYDRVGFDIPQGALFATTNAGLSNCWAGLTVRDDFVVTGLPSGTPLTLTAHLAVSAHYGCLGVCMGGGSAIEATLRAVDLDEATWTPGCVDECEVIADTVLTVSVPCYADAPFRMEYVLWSSAAELSGRVDAVFSFEGLAPGSSLQSCRGFVQDYVATRPVTWGRVKALYR
jgi:hypothetical protein